MPTQCLSEPTWQTDDGRIQLFHGDCLDVLGQLEAGSVDAVVTDPPYGIGYCHGARKGGRIMGMDGRAIVGDDEPFDPAPLLAFPSVVLWGANHYASRLPDRPCWLVWDKRDGVNSNDQADCEMAWTNMKGVARLRTRYWNGTHAKEKTEPQLHSNQKPVMLMQWCLEVAKVPEGAVVLDPYCGSGTTAIACIRTGRRFIGVEIDRTYFDVARKRIETELEQGRLFT